MSGTSRLVALGADDDARRVDALDDAVALGDDADAGVARERGLPCPVPTSGACGADERHGLALHVRAHERAVGVVVLEERHERRGDRHHLVRRDVHQLDHVGRDHLEVAVEARGDSVSLELALLVEVGRRLGDVLALLFERASTSCTSSVTGRRSTLAVRRLDEAVLVDARERRERRDEADVRTFRRLDRADAAVVRRRARRAPRSPRARA